MYEARTENAQNEHLEITCLQSMCLERLFDHLELQSARLQTLDKCKTEILRFPEIHEPREVPTGESGHDGRPDQWKGKRARKRVQRKAKAKGRKHPRHHQINSSDNAESAAHTYTKHNTMDHQTSAVVPANSTGKS